MKSAKELKEKYEVDLNAAQKKCKHKKTFWAEEAWAPGHMTGRRLKICEFCHKVVDSTEATEEI